MAFKDILVHLDDGPRAAERLDLAFRLAEIHQSHLVALAVRGRSQALALMTAPLGADVETLLLRADAEAAATAKALLDTRPPPAGVSVEWRDVAGPPAEMAALHARYADLVIVGQMDPAHAGPGRLSPDGLILSVGRPVLVVPYAGRFPRLGRRVLVAWNGTREATRAVHDALPILVRAEQVLVLVVNPQSQGGGHGDIPGADISLHLSRHGVAARCQQVHADDLKAGEMVLNRAADEDADLVVMGGYGRSRLREMVLGGTTRHMLDHMTVPVLFSH